MEKLLGAKPALVEQMTGNRIRLGLLAASPMHIQSPLYRRIAADPHLDFTAIFASSAGVRPYNAGYSQPMAWDVDLLSGYRSVFLSRANRNTLSGGFFGLRDFDVVKTIIKGRYEVLWIHGYNHLTHQLAALTQMSRRKGILFREEQTLLHGRPLWKRLAKALWLRSLFRRGLVLYIGTENKRWFASFGVTADRMFFTPYCADNGWLRAEARRLQESRDQLRLAFGLRRDVPVVLMVARLIPKKQPILLLEAFRRVRQRLPCALLIVGSGECEESLKRKIERECIPDVRLVGFLSQSRIGEAYSAADIFVLSSKCHETWGIVVNEAMNFELPLIVTDKVGSGSDLVVHGKNGFIVSCDEPSDLAERLAQLVSQPTLRKEFGCASLELVKAWDFDITARGVLAATAAAVGPERWSRAQAGGST